MNLSIPRVLVAIGAVLVITPALVPVQPVLFHETGPGTAANGSQIATQGIEVVAYENLSDRGKELYRRALQNRGVYTVPVGQGASDFEYPSGDEESDSDEGPRSRFQQPGLIAIERPANSSLPEADEPVRMAEERRRPPQQGQNGSENNTTTPSVEQRREQIMRYDLMITRTGTPGLTASPNLVRLLAVLLGIVSLGVGGYLGSRP